MERLPYWNAPYPFNDFVVMSYTKGVVSSDKIELIRRNCTEIGVENFEQTSNRLHLVKSLSLSR